MQFKNRIPESAIQGNNTSDFIEVLDALYDYKFSEVAKSLRLHNPVLFLNRDWMVKQLSDYGVLLPETLPLQVIQQFLLNVDTITGLRGSKIGIELWLSVITLGKVTINDENFYSYPEYLSLDSLTQGTMPSDTSSDRFFLVSATEHLGTATTLDVEVKSVFFNGSFPEYSNIIQEFIQNNIKEYVGFANRLTINYTFEDYPDYYFHKLLNTYYI